MSHYETLGVSKTATKDEISKAYKKLVRKLHPDADNSPEAAIKFKEVTNAYEILKDEQKRSQYDNPRSSFFDQIRNGFSFNPFQQNQQENLNKRTFVEIDFIEAVKGCKKTIYVESKIPCDHCKGIGWMTSETCNSCHGTGHVFTKHGPWDIQMDCPSCQTVGKTFKDQCPKCKNGYNDAPDETIELTIPAGVDQNNVMKIPDKGEYGANNTRGYLFVVINVKPHSVFTRHGLDLLCSLSVPYSKLYFGSEINVPIIDGTATAKVPPKTLSGSKLRLRGQGVKSSYQQGDMILTLNCQMPDNPSEEYLKKLKELAELES